MLQITSGQTVLLMEENFHLPSESIKEHGKSSKAIPFKGAEGCSYLYSEAQKAQTQSNTC